MIDDVKIPNVPKIAIFGAGGGGNNTIGRLSQLGISGADLIAVNTDLQHLLSIKEYKNKIKKLLIGKKTTRCFGAGGDPIKGRMAAYENIKELEDLLMDYEMVVMVAGMGGGTGTGSAPVIAEIAKKIAHWWFALSHFHS